MKNGIGNEDEISLFPIATGQSQQQNPTRKKYPTQIYQSNLPTSIASLKLMQAKKGTLMNRKVKKIFLCISFIGCILMFVLYGYVRCPINNLFCTEKSVLLPTPSSSHHSQTPVFNGRPTFEEILEKDFQFNIEGHDVMVFLHIQETGGTSFGKHLVKDLELQRPCSCHRKVKKRCTCLRPGPNSKETWLFSRYSTGWKCGLHADMTELTGCVDEVMNTKIDAKNVKRRYFYITYLRDPVHRYQSEFKHVGRGATWRNTRLFCGGRPATEEEVPTCYEGDYWDDVTVEDFYSCKSNLAINRQTRMLADLNLVNCYNTTGQNQQDRDSTLLESAKRNLDKMVFFGLTEFQENSQYIFEETFNLNFSTRFFQDNQTAAVESLEVLSAAQLESIQAANHLDIKLYQYAKELFQKRYEKLKSLDTQFESHYHNMGHMQFSWYDVDKVR